MTTVTGKLIGPEHPDRVEITATLVDVTGARTVGYVASVPGEVVQPQRIHANAETGVWTADLLANTAIVSDAGDTLWCITEGRAADGTPVRTYIAVPASGSYWMGDLRADLSDTQSGQGTVVYLGGTPGSNGASAYDIAVTNGFVGSQAEWLASLVGPKGDPGSGGGAVASVNDLTGDVVLDAAAVGADPAGAATAAQAAAVSTAATDAAARVAAHTAASDPHGDRAAAATALAGHVAASDPHGDRAAAAAALAAHESDTTSVHGIADTSVLETTSGSQAKADTAQTAATSAAAGDATAKVSTHTAASDPHGDRSYTDTQIATRAPASRQITAGTGLAGGGNLTADRTLSVSYGTAAGTAAQGNDSRLSDSRTPTAHAASHATAGSDPIAPAAIGAETAGTATAAVTTHTGASDPHGDRAYADGKLAKASNLSDLGSASTARSNLGLGGAATLAVGTGAGTVAAGDDARITGALQSSGGTVSGNLAVTGNALGLDTPAIHGAAAWCYDPALAVNSTQLTAGILYLTRVDIAAAITVTKLYWWVANTGSGATTNQNWVGLYNSAGTLLASANVDTGFSSATLKTTTITSTALSAGQFYWVGLLFNASVTPTLTRGSGWTGVDVAANLGLAASAYRFAKNGTTRTTLPSPLTPASNTGSDIAGPWVAVGA